MLAQKYLSTQLRKPFDHIILAHFDSHGVSFGAGRKRVLEKEGKEVRAVAKFPETGPNPAFADFIDNLLKENTARVFEVIDIPVNVRQPEIHINALRKLAQEGRLVMYDHHETDIGFLPVLLEFASVLLASDTFVMASALQLVTDDVARELAIVGTVADRDREGYLKFAEAYKLNENDLQRYIDLANRMDVLVRSPQQFGYSSLEDVINALSQNGVSVIPSVEPPFYQLVNEAQVVKEGMYTILADFSNVPPMWTPKTAERLLQLRNKHYAVIVAPAIDPRTKQQVGWDARILQYWLSDLEDAEKVIAPLLAEVPPGSVVGHGRYISVRFSERSQAESFAERAFQRLEGNLPSVMTFIRDTVVADAVRRDYTAILHRLTEILETMKEMYSKYLELKEEQVRLLRETQRHEYD